VGSGVEVMCSNVISYDYLSKKYTYLNLLTQLKLYLYFNYFSKIFEKNLINSRLLYQTYFAFDIIFEER
jgi:hypothetical protein